MTGQFVDGVLDVFVIGGVARLEFFKLNPQHQPGKSSSERPELKREQALSIAMPVEAFFKAVEVLEKVRDEINESRSGTASGAAEPRAISPNFKRDS